MDPRYARMTGELGITESRVLLSRHSRAAGIHSFIHFLCHPRDDNPAAWCTSENGSPLHEDDGRVGMTGIFEK